MLLEAVHITIQDEIHNTVFEIFTTVVKLCMYLIGIERSRWLADWMGNELSWKRERERSSPKVALETYIHMLPSVVKYALI